MASHSKIRLAAALVGTALGAAVIGGSVFLYGDDSNQRVAAAPGFSVLERPQAPIDRLPKAALQNPLVADVADPSTSRRGAVSGSRTAYVFKSATGDLCKVLVIGGQLIPTVVAGCSPSGVIAGPLLYAETESSPQIAVGVVPDSVESARSGGRAVAISANMYILDVPASDSRITLTRDSGETETVEVRRP